MSRRGIIIASFGSIYQDAVEKSIGTIEYKVRDLYEEAVIRRVFLSEALVEKWNSKFEDLMYTLDEVLQEFETLSIDEVYIQPITLVAD